MDCKQARKLMHEALDGRGEVEPALAEHLSACAACRNEYAALGAVQNLVAAKVAGEPPQESLERVSAGVLGRLAREKQVHAGAAWRSLAVAAGLLLVFGLGLLAGRELWPREVVRVERVPQVVERIVEREVRVVEERVVVERVPVVRTRIVYRDRPAESATTDLPPAPAEPVALEEHEIVITAA
jgi:predicted anti-sigma-YlaC factor YlaD